MREEERQGGPGSWAKWVRIAAAPSEGPDLVSSERDTFGGPPTVWEACDSASVARGKLRAVDDGGFPAPVADLTEIRELGQGAYTVPETCLILRPSMTSRKVHYWLDADLLGEPLRKGTRGVSTLLTFEQVLKVRTLQHLRDELDFSLQSVRRGLERLLAELTAPEWHELTFFRTGAGEIGFAGRDRDPVALLSSQGVLAPTIPKLTEFIAEMREQWDTRRLKIEDYPSLVSDAAVLGGSPVIDGTRVETAFIANLATELTRGEIRALFPNVEESAIAQAADFEDVELAAA